MPNKRANVKNEKQYEALKDKGMSKERAAKIANDPGSSSKGGKASGSGKKNTDSSQGGTTAQKKEVSVRVEALGNVTTIASVAIKPRIDSEITGVHFADGARVKKGDILVRLAAKAILGIDDVVRALNAETVGRRMELAVLREGALRIQQVTPAERASIA